MDETPSTNFVFITGGVVSSLGKGVSTAAIASLLQAHGYKVRTRKLDPYLNIDPGTMSPYEHGEVFVTEDGAETDLDLGHYERFTDVMSTKNDNITTGQIYQNLLDEERKGTGKLLGRTMQVVPHVTDAIKEFVMAGLTDEDFVLCEIGGTVGDIESLPFLEAIRQIGNDLGRTRVFYIHMTLLPYLRAAGELKTKPTQHSVKGLLSVGIQPDMLICRAEHAIEDRARLKISRFCNVDAASVVSAPDLESIYEIPVCYTKARVDRLLLHHFGKKLQTKSPDARWQKILRACRKKTHQATIAIVGKYTEHGDSYKSLVEALQHGGLASSTAVDIAWIEAEELEQKKFPANLLEQACGILIPGGFGVRGSRGKIETIAFARKHKIPFFGICFGMQMAVIEYARHVLGIAHADSVEFQNGEEKKFEPVVCLLEEWNQEERTERRSANGNLGGSMRLGAYPCAIRKNTLAYRIYKEERVSERHRHRFEINSAFCARLEQHGMVFSGMSPDGKLPEIMEMSQDLHPWFLGVQFHPELKSRPFAPHPVFRHFVKAASRHGKLV